ncbi:retropepsin-like aspartic protease family protein [Sphingomonas flavalba]|uniref:retropepsin-like aspartic protease family protein n=1 Tax=Sphingomonas flavalba TaxID=2559804 RepID=UPI00109DAB79|nr:TIGR02281 family clan AA aspartic protease [Sphingomonas flavalba]
MNEDQSIEFVWLIGALILVGSSLIVRRMPIGQTLKMVAAWVGIFGVGLVIVSFRGELTNLWYRVAGDLTGSQTVGNTLRLPMSDDGHFWVSASVNGRSQRFLIDSGATTTALSAATARAAGVAVDDGALPVLLNTANGVVRARRGKIERFDVGPITARDLSVVIAPEFGNTNVIGMNFLTTLKSWRVEGRSLVLEPRGG